METEYFFPSAANEPPLCPRSEGLAEFEAAIQNLMNQILKLEVREQYSESSITSLTMNIDKVNTKPQCLFRKNEQRFEEVLCTSKTKRIEIFLKQMEDDMSVEGNFYTADWTRIVILEAKLTAKLNEAFMGKTDLSTHVLKLVELNIQNITAILNAQPRPVPSAYANPWKTWVLKNTERLLKQAFLQHKLVQCKV
ncbi:unnamed protein product [Schistocephalus solidus]|uniref:Interleukin-12 subunit alpha n=1 Tax=Schistocephalus solidus TaxID=70667 RepID=A0A183TMY4_SCHSO|nr:unnamed protein product [Schistocephalus solidus]